MVKIFNTRQKLEYAWDHVTLALFLKYPNPFSVHVISADVIDRYIDPLGRLCSTRLIHKKGSIPNWIQYVPNTLQIIIHSHSLLYIIYSLIFSGLKLVMLILLKRV